METEIKKILIKCPRTELEIIGCFPFIVTISEEFPKAEINIIVEDNCSLALSFLPFKVKVYERPVVKKSLIETHHFCANMNAIFNIDLFFDLENSFNSAFMGFNFRAVERVGFEVKWNKVFLTKKYPLPVSLSIEKQSMKLLELYLNKPMQDIRISKTKETGQSIDTIEKLFKEPEPPKFIMIMLDNFINTSAQIELWKIFFDSFQKQKFIIWSQFDENIISDLFASIDLGHNDLFIQRGSNIKEMIYLFSKVKGIVTNNLWAEGVCNYIGVDSLTLLDKKTHLPQYDFFKFKPQRIFLGPDGIIEHHVLDEVREMKDINQVVDQIHFNFKL
ncbi:MAG: hypothetical protein HOP07_08245 [Bacteriovoracaceae bacterium]|nr:hypothetical protein [Bacteriovoracaceae bacterium]